MTIGKRTKNIELRNGPTDDLKHIRVMIGNLFSTQLNTMAARVRTENDKTQQLQTRYKGRIYRITIEELT